MFLGIFTSEFLFYFWSCALTGVERSCPMTCVPFCRPAKLIGVQSTSQAKLISEREVVGKATHMYNNIDLSPIFS